MGRRLGSRNQGFFFRAGRGWYMQTTGPAAETHKDTKSMASVKPRMVPLRDEHGNPLKDKSLPKGTLKAAYVRGLRAAGQLIEDEGDEDGGGATVEQVCDAYLAKAKGESSQKTYTDRRDTLFDFCYGFPPRFQKIKPTEKDRIHKGYGSKPVSKLIRKDIDDWLNAHPTWKGGRRTRVQAVKRALNYGVECQLVSANPIRGYRVQKQVARVTYITPEQERALCRLGNAAIATAIKVCIRTGARPGCEFAKLTASHVQIRGERMEWKFKAEESKTGKERVLRITDPEIVAIVKRLRRKYPRGPLFRNNHGTPWKRQTLAQGFLRAKELVVEKHPRRFGPGKNHAFDEDTCMYSCRHTYAKRTLMGYWTGKQTNIEVLARLMGNSPQVCRDHYLQWTTTYDEPLWESA